MNKPSSKKLLLALFLSFASFITLPAYAWPEVDHMNMCGAAIKVDRAYGGQFRGWVAHDKFVAYRTRAGYYYRNNCPTTKAPVKKAKKATIKKIVKNVVRTKRIARSSKAKPFKKRVKYDEHADCVRVDNMNSSGSPVVRKRK